MIPAVSLDLADRDVKDLVVHTLISCIKTGVVWGWLQSSGTDI